MGSRLGRQSVYLLSPTSYSSYLFVGICWNQLLWLHGCWLIYGWHFDQTTNWTEPYGETTYILSGISNSLTMSVSKDVSVYMISVFYFVLSQSFSLLVVTSSALKTCEATVNALPFTFNANTIWPMLSLHLCAAQLTVCWFDLKVSLPWPILRWRSVSSACGSDFDHCLTCVGSRLGTI